MLTPLIGKTSPKIKNTVERGAVKKFAEAIGDFHPIYVNEEAGKQSKYKQNIAPPTFPRVFDYGVVEGLQLPANGLIHGEQIYEYKRPLLLEETVYCSTKIENYYEKEGKSGKMAFLVLTQTGEDEYGEEIFKGTQIVILTEAVLKEVRVNETT